MRWVKHCGVECVKRLRNGCVKFVRIASAMHVRIGWACGCACLFLIDGCGAGLSGPTASLGGTTAGGRGNVNVLFINNTASTAVFTFGSFDPLDQMSAPDFDQFGLDPGGRMLMGNGQSGILPIRCARVLSLGGPRLLALIGRNRPDAPTDEQALVEGIEFFEPSPDGAGEDVLVGTSPPFEARLGVDFPCGALVILRLEFDERFVEPFRVDFELIPSQSTR